jgi:beta-1,2-mannobiose phosphorylase / 1,2-beta-oligomannan phosphorylase
MINVSQGKILLESRLNVDFENEGVLNPTCIQKDGIVHMFYRAVRKGNFSTIGYCQIKDGVVIYQSDKPVLIPEYLYESMGIEDPRITLLDGKYYMLYTAYDGTNALIAYATSNDLKNWTKKGLISPQISYDEAEDIFKDSGVSEKYTFFEKYFRYERSDKVHLWEKDAMLFPKKIKGKYALIHRVMPGIQICYFDDFDDLTQSFWRNYLKDLNSYLILDPKFDYESGYVGGGALPIETKEGWILIHHSVEENRGNRVYRASAALLDIDDPQKVIGRLSYPLFSPDEDWEKNGVVNNVVFPTGTSIKGEELSIYYGAADSRIGIRTLNINELLKELLK